jgi:hypothetical protein
MLDSPRRLSPVHNLEASNLNWPATLLQSIVTELRTDNRYPIVIKIKVGTLSRVFKRVGNGLVHSIASKAEITADVTFKQPITKLINEPS